MKQTYSVWVQTDKGRRKWHLSKKPTPCFLINKPVFNPARTAAYFTQTTIDQLGTIDDNPQIRDIVVEEGMFKSTRVGKSRAKTDDSSRSDATKSSASVVARTYAPFPTPYQYQQNESGTATPVLMHEPYQSRQLDPSASPGYEQTPSPISSSPVVPYQLNHGSYSSASPAPGPYLPTGFSMGSSSVSHSLNPTSSGAHSAEASPAPEVQLSVLRGHGHTHGPNYYSPGAVSPLPWNGNNANTAFSPRPADPFHRQQHHPHNSPNSMNTNIRASSYPSPSNYRTAANHATASPHSYTSHTSLLAAGHSTNHVFSSYSLHSALALPNVDGSTAPSIDHRGLQLSPLHIPDRMQGGMSGSNIANLTDTTNMATRGGGSDALLGDGDVPMDAVAAAAAGDNDHDEGGLRLPLLRPPVVKYVRDPQDEKILRRLQRDGNGSS